MKIKQYKGYSLVKLKMPNGTKSPFYSVEFFVDGKRIRRSTKKSRLNEADNWVVENIKPLIDASSLAAVMDRVVEIKNRGKSIAIGKGFDHYLKFCPRDSISAKSTGQKRSVYDDFVSYSVASHGRKMVHDVTEQDAKSYIVHIRNKGKWDRWIRYRRPRKHKSISYEREMIPLSAKSANLYLEILSDVFSGIMADAGMTKNPFGGISRIKLRGKNKGKSRDIFSDAQIRSMAAKADGFQRVILVLGLYTGLSKKDICLLKWDEVDFVKLVIVRVREKTSERLQVPIMGPLERFLRGLSMEGDYCFPVHAEMYNSGNADGVSWRFKKLMEGCGIEYQRRENGKTINMLGIHALRHTFAKIAAYADPPVPLGIVQGILGHRSAKVTEIYTAHVSLDMAKTAMRNAFASVPDYFSL